MEIRERLTEAIRGILDCTPHKNISMSDIERIINSISESAYEPQDIVKKIYADEDKIFNCKVSEAIEYLSSYKDCKLCEEWHYDDRYFVFIKKDIETEDKIFARLFEYVKNECGVKATLPDFTLSPEKYRIKPKPKYRPFKSQQECFKEMNCHPDFGWLIIVETGEEATVEAVHSDKIILTNDFECLFKDAFKCYKFTDNTPFGIKDSLK